MNQFIKTLKWRYAVKKFDTNKKISSVKLNHIIQAAILSPSSYGLQPYKIIVIKNQETKKKLQKYSKNNIQITDSSHVIILAIKKLCIQEINKYFKNMISLRNKNINQYHKYKKTIIKNLIKTKTKKQQESWQKEQVYIMLGILIYYCALEKIDTCPIGGFENKKFDKILNLKNQNLKSVIVLTLGYRSNNDSYQYEKKVRSSTSDLVLYY